MKLHGLRDIENSLRLSEARRKPGEFPFLRVSGTASDSVPRTSGQYCHGQPDSLRGLADAPAELAVSADWFVAQADRTTFEGSRFDQPQRFERRQLTKQRNTAA